jgi:hypothetical protein
VNVQELAQALKELGVPSRVYSLHGWADERLCLEKASTTDWRVLFVERGQERTLRTFRDEADACAFVLEELRQEI